MLDFAIFAVTFLLALVGAVLYLYPVTPGLGLGVRLRREDLGGRSAGSACGRVTWLRPGVRSSCACVLWSLAVVLGGSLIPTLSRTGFGRWRSVSYLGSLGTLTPSNTNPVCFYIRGETPSIFS